MTNHRAVVQLAVLVSLYAPFLHADPAVSGSVEIRAKAPEIAPAPTAGRSMMTAEEIDASGAASVAAVLGLLPGISVSSNGPAGSQAAASIRGSTTNQVLVLVDGSPVSDPSSGLTDFSKLGLAPEDIESIEVVKGGASAQYGPDAVGGVILIRTRRARDLAGPVLDIKAANVSRLPFASVTGSGISEKDVAPDFLSLADGQEASIHLGLPGGFAMGIGGERSANAYLCRDTDGTKRSRENADLLSGWASASWNGVAWAGSLDAGLAGSLRSLGVPGPIDAPTPGATEEDTQVRANLGYSTDAFLSDRVAFEASAYGISSGTLYRETVDEEDDANLASRAGLDARWSLLANDRLTVGSGLTGRYERLDSSNVTDSSGGVPERFSAGAYVEPAITFGAWTLVSAARFDWTSDFPSGFSLSLGAARAVTPTLTASANASTAYRSPSFNDLYWPASPGVEGNPGLEPESSSGGDIGLRHEDRGLSIAATIHARYVEDVILWQPGGDGVWRPGNHGSAFYPGVELEGGLSGSSPFSARFSYAFLHSYQLSGDLDLYDDLRVPMVSEHSFDLTLAFEERKLRASVDFDYAGLRYQEMANVAYDPARLVVNAHLRLGAGETTAFTLDAENLLDERYESVQGYPMPGFSLRAGFEMRLGGTR
ncbi:MAG: TonB-dependent receptor [Spirochaetes bacterium]|nr:TonB-dependent receptor [Spirochaetota bacterium]